MSYSIVYSSRTGNTKMLADCIKETLPQDECVYFGELNDDALKADRIYVGFWTDKGRCDDLTVEFLKLIDHQEVFLFGTAGFGQGQTYFDNLIKKTKTFLKPETKVVGTYMCQGKMPMSVRERYEKMLKMPVPAKNLKMLIENFDQALTHPDQHDLDMLAEKIKENI